MARHGYAVRLRASRLEKAEGRGLLVQCAMRVFARSGLGAARHAEIARKAKVSVPTMFCYFPTRKALVNVVHEEVVRFFTEMAERVHSKRGSAAEIILEHLRALADAVETDPKPENSTSGWLGFAGHVN
jgi:TetR/AcrR family transcriptional regulator, hemagglutinin/protease regulatory protein